MTYTCTRGRAACACAWLLVAAAPSWGQAQEQRATLVVRLPADARLVVDRQETKQTGEVRRFFSPPLPAGQGFRYELEATWTGDDGKPVKRTRVARVRAGEKTEIDLRTEDKAPPDRPPVDRPPVDKPPPDRPPVGKEREPDVIFVATPQEVVDKMLEMAAVKKDDVVYDLGCGDGRIVVTAAKKYGCKAVGFDIDPRRIEESQENVKKEGVGDLVSIEKKDIFTVDLSKASVVTLYLLPNLNVKLVPQLEKMKPGSRIVSHNYDIEGYKPKEWAKVRARDGVEHNVYLWVVPLEKEKEK
jgi:uncharacterized protein (TIGR03000 family)